MITNLLASVVISLVTNRTETVSKHWVPEPCPIAAENPGYGCLALHGHFEDDRNPTSKTIATEIVERKTVRFTLGDESWESFKDRSLTNWTESFVLKTETKWIKGIQPLGVEPTMTLGAVVMTNISSWAVQTTKEIKTP